jgi:hypothetical protein
MYTHVMGRVGIRVNACLAHDFDNVGASEECDLMGKTLKYAKRVIGKRGS